VGVLGIPASVAQGQGPDERSIRAALIEPIEPIVVTRLFEDLTTR